MDEQKIYHLIRSGNRGQENQGLKMLNAQKDFFLRKHRFPSYFNAEDKDDIFYWGVFKLLENTRNSTFEYKTTGNLEAYLYTLINRRIYHKTRARKLEELTVIKENKRSTTTSVFEDEVLQKIQEVFDQKLGENCRKILLMRYQDGLKQKEIAEELGLALGTVKNNSSECMNKLKKLIEQNAELGQYIKGLLTH